MGLALAKLCDDELVKDKFYFRLMTYVLLALAIICLIFFKITSIILALIYMILVIEILIYKGRIINKNKK